MSSILLIVAAQTVASVPTDSANGPAAPVNGDSVSTAPASSSAPRADAAAPDVRPARAVDATASTASERPGVTGESGPPRRWPFEFTVQLSLGGGARWAPMAAEPAGFFTIAWRADMLFLRNSPRSFGLGPALAVRVDHFADVVPSLGASVLLPVHEALPIVLTPAFALRWDGASWAPGASGRLYWGVRSHNFHGSYALAIGLWIEGRRFFDPQSTTDIAAGIDLDLQLIAIPFVALYTELFRRTRAN